jgi:hypothetical protein
MSVGSVSSTLPASSNELGEAKVGGREVKNDHDGDDTGTASAAAAPSLGKVNASGQQIGLIINKSA